MSKYIKFLGNKTTNEVEKNYLRTEFQNLSSNLKDLSIAIQSIMDSNYSTEEKLLRIADLNNGYKGANYVKEIRDAADAISNTMSKKGTKIDLDMFQSILNMCREKSLQVFLCWGLRVKRAAY
ncbi:MAG: hypothetical protein Q4G47_05040 [Lachnospiraceae bacterium]|nr:hypothetical protein [Lachnospiraceae bacterium]